VGFEALARLTDADGLDIAPDVFISVAEDTGIIVPLGAHMLELASDQLATWREQLPGMGDVTMAVNVSALQAQHASLGEDVERVLAAHRLRPFRPDPGTDRDSAAARRPLHHRPPAVLRDKGVGIAIDDFGTGYASLRYLAMLPVSAVKVDKSFTAGLPADETSSKIVNAWRGWLLTWS
jgi:EAL domain-containing protein (putative c-di-GMP-specific phosphodiesterase class I)